MPEKTAHAAPAADRVDEAHERVLGVRRALSVTDTATLGGRR